MALITATHLTTSGSDTDTSSYTTASITPTANLLILVAVENRTTSGTTNTPTISGNGLTWVEVVSRISVGAPPNIRVTVFRSMGASPSAGAITIDMAAQTQSHCAWSIAEFANIDTSGTNGSGAIVQNAGNSDEATNTGLTVTLAAFGDANNATFGAARTVGDGTIKISPGTGFTELGEFGGLDSDFQSQWRNDNDTSVDWTWASTASFAVGAAVEIKNATTGAVRGYKSLLGVGQA